MRLIFSGLVLALVGCASVRPPSPDTALPPNGAITYLPPVAEVTLVTAAGLREPQLAASETARINLADALSSVVPASAIDQSGDPRTRAEALARKLDDQPTPTPALLQMAGNTPTDFVALIRVSFDVESSASRLVQGGLGLMFGGVPGPDGINRTAQIALFDPASGDLIWNHTTAALDPRDPDTAKRLIIELIAASTPETDS
jgi:hypothetical protein